ncbi:MAG: hypothetical protein ACK4Q5_16395, partial [Saprospiraceae bacterium]
MKKAARRLFTGRLVIFLKISALSVAMPATATTVVAASATAAAAPVVTSAPVATATTVVTSASVATASAPVAAFARAAALGAGHVFLVGRHGAVGFGHDG